jgi:hypothetical protein
MAIAPVSGALPARPATPQSSFPAVLRDIERKEGPLAHASTSATVPPPEPRLPTHPRPSSTPPRPLAWAQDLAQGVQAAQARLDALVALGRSGQSFTPAQLLALQADASRASLTVEAAGRAVEKVTQGLRQVLQTQL